MEIWEKIQESTHYEISNFGRVRNSNTGLILKGRLSKNGYLQVSISLKSTGKFSNRYIHRLVAIYFLDNPENKREVNHKNGNKIDNNVDNLEWATSSENQLHRHNVLKKTATSQRKIGQFTKEGILVEKFPSIVSAARSFEKSRVNIDNALQKKQKTAYGYFWRYLD